MSGLHPRKLNRAWTDLEKEIARRIYSREAIHAGAFAVKRPFDARSPSRQMTRALIDARTVINRLNEMGLLPTYSSPFVVPKRRISQ